MVPHGQASDSANTAISPAGAAIITNISACLCQLGCNHPRSICIAESSDCLDAIADMLQFPALVWPGLYLLQALAGVLGRDMQEHNCGQSPAHAIFAGSAG